MKEKAVAMEQFNYLFWVIILQCIDWAHHFFQIQLKSLAEEMQAIVKGLEKVKQEFAACANDGPVSAVFHEVLRIFMSVS